MNTPVRLMIIFGFAALIIACLVTPKLSAGGPGGPDVLTQVLGGTAELASEGAYKEADLYFHGGVDDEKVVAVQKSDLFLAKTFERLNNEATPKAHRHLSAKEERELLPWFIATVKLNPHYIEAWCTGTYWYYRVKEPDKAVDFISEGIMKNPDSYEVYMERGILNHRLSRMREAAADLARAEKLWKNNSEDAPYNLRTIHSFLKDAKKHIK